MYHILFDKNNSYKAAFLIKLTALKKSSLEKYYLEPLLDKGIKSNECIAFSLNQDAKTAKPQRAYLETLLPALTSLNITHVLVNDSGYFKVLTGVKDTTCVYGGVYPCVIDGFKHLKIILGINYQVFIHDPKQKDKLDLSIEALANSLNGIYLNKKPKFTVYNTFTRNDHIEHIKEAFSFLIQQPELAVDIEDVSLNVTETVVGTISFSWSDSTAYVFAVASDYATEGSTINTADNYYQEMIRFLGIFFKNYSGKFIGHNTNYDFKVLIFNTFMRKDFFAYSDLIEGIETLCRNFDDTKLIAYLATNSTSRNELGLKTLALPFAGNYGRDDITDITKIPLDELMEYNAIDTISTIWVRNKYYPIMVNDDQLSVYETIFKPSVKDVLHMCLIGVPLDYERVLEVAKIVEEDLTKASKQLMANKYVIELVKWLRYDEFTKCNEKWKKKQEPLEYFDYVKYNPASNNHNQELLYEVMGFDVVDTTEKGNPSTGGDTLKKLKHLTDDPDKIQVLDLLIDIAEAAIISDNFLQKFIHNSVKKPDGYYYLFGDFNLGGTVSGRLSSSNPNLQNLPSTGNKYAKLIKSCVVAPAARYELIDRTEWDAIVAPLITI